MAEYKLAVTTGSMKYAGTMDHIYATLIGTEGQSERTELDKIGFDFLTDTTRTYTIKPKSSLGNLLLLQLEKDPFLFLPENQWFCSKIVVTAPEGELLFPCYRWISRGELVELRGGKAKKSFEDVHPMLIEHREKDIMMRKNLYKWEITDEKIPHHLHYKHVSELPAEVQFSMTREDEIQYTKKMAGIELKFKGMVDSKEQWEKIEDMNDIFCFQKTTISEYVAEHWKDDDFFGYQFLNGTNPTVIKKCSKLPSNFPVTDEMVKPFLAAGCSLKKEIKRGNIFICDNKIMDKIPTRMYGEEPLQMPASMCLFYLNPENKLMPIAIQLNQQPSEQNPIFLPSDSEPDWLLAKIFVRSAHALEFESVDHLLGTHFLAEVFTVAALRNFHPVHPLHKLLIPHFEYTLHINTLGRIILVGPEGILNTSTLGYEGTQELVRRGFAEITYSSLCLPDNIAARGLESIPNYYYRDDGLKLWNIINRFILFSKNEQIQSNLMICDISNELTLHSLCLATKGVTIHYRFGTGRLFQVQGCARVSSPNRTEVACVYFRLQLHVQSVYLVANASEKPEMEDPPLSLKSPAWEHFSFWVKYCNGERPVDKTRALCQACSAEIGYVSRNMTNILTHLKRHHPSVNITATRKKTSFVQTQLTSAFKQPLPSNSDLTKAITTAIGVFIAADKSC